MSKDNWQHRSIQMRCNTCMWFVPKVVNMSAGQTIPVYDNSDASPWLGQVMKEGYRLGRCRRHAPTMSGWPVVFATDWCGEHKLDEEKI